MIHMLLKSWNKWSRRCSSKC